MCFLVGVVCTHFLSHCLWFLCHIICKNKKKTSGHVWHLEQVNLPASDSTVHSLYLHVAASTWENWKRNTVDVVCITSSEFLYPLYHQKHSLRNRAFFTPFSNKGYQVQFCHNSYLQILPKRSMRTKSITFRITFDYTRPLFRVISPHNNFPFKQ